MKSLLVYLSMIAVARCFVLPQRPVQRLENRLLYGTSSALQAAKRVVFLGTPEVAASTLETLHKASLEDGLFEIVSVVTQPPKRRRRKIEATPVGKVAEELGLPVLCPEKANKKDFLDHFQALEPDLSITAAYGQYLPKRFLSTAPTVNIHPSLLPKWRGASPVQRSLQNGDNPIGVSVLYTVSEMDAGPLIAQDEYDVSTEEKTSTVLPLLFAKGTDLLLQKLPSILDGTVETTTQNDDDATSASLIHSSEGELKAWCNSATVLHNQIRAFDTWPGCFFYLKVGDREPIKVKVLESRVVEEETGSPTQTISVGPTKKSGLFLTCHDGSILELITVQPATRKAFRARDLQNGYPGETLEWMKTPEDAKENANKYSSRSK